MLFRQRGIIKTDMSIRGKSVYCAIVVDTVHYDKKKAILSTVTTLHKFVIPSSYTKVTNKLEMLVLIKAILMYGTNYLYHSDSKGAVNKLRQYKDLNIIWIPRGKNPIADKHSKTTVGFKQLQKIEVEYLLNLTDKIELGEKYIID